MAEGAPTPPAAGTAPEANPTATATENVANIQADSWPRKALGGLGNIGRAVGFAGAGLGLVAGVLGGTPLVLLFKKMGALTAYFAKQIGFKPLLEQYAEGNKKGYGISGFEKTGK